MEFILSSFFGNCLQRFHAHSLHFCIYTWFIMCTNGCFFYYKHNIQRYTTPFSRQWLGALVISKIERQVGGAGPGGAKLPCFSHFLSCNLKAGQKIARTYIKIMYCVFIHLFIATFAFIFIYIPYTIYHIEYFRKGGFLLGTLPR